MLTFCSIMLLGFFLGMRHATDADHIVAVTTIVSRERTIRNAAFIGIVWGIGHSLTVLLVGGAIIVFGLVVPRRLGLSLEFSVALMLILLGLFNLRSFSGWLRQAKVGDHKNSHLHDHELEGQPLASRRSQPNCSSLHLYQTIRPLIVGIVHGLAGSAAVALLVLPIIQNPFLGLAYLLIFGLGTISGMMLITAAVAFPFAYTAGRWSLLNRHLALASSSLSIAFGFFLVYQIGFVDGLFTK